MLDEERPDVVAAWHFGALSLGLLRTVAERGIPLVLAVCDDWLLYGPALDRWSARFTGPPWRRLAGRAVDAVRAVTGVPATVPDLGALGPVCFVSHATRRRAEATAPWSFPVATVVHSGIDRQTFPSRSGPPPERPWNWRLLHCGRFDERKGADTLVRALGDLPGEATACFYGRGGGGERARLQALAEELGVADRVRFGTLERDDLAEAYADADAFVFPSRWEEPFGLTPVEAMACDTPVVATAVGGAAEFLVDGENCLVFPVDDASALAAAVSRLADDTDLRRRLVEGGRRLAADLDADRLADVFEAWYVAAARNGEGGWPPHRPAPGRPPGSPPLGVPGDGRPDALAQDAEAEAVARALVGEPAELVPAPLAGAVAAAAGRRVAVVAPNHHDADRLRMRARRWWTGSGPPPSPGVARRAVLDAVRAAGIVVTEQPIVGWRRGRRAAVATRVVRALRLRSIDRFVAVVGQRS